MCGLSPAREPGSPFTRGELWERHVGRPKHMGKQYKPKKPTGREYVDKTKEWVNTTIYRCGVLPEQWKETMLNPLVETVIGIEDLVVEANAVYINESVLSTEDAIKAYQQRDELLYEALRKVKNYDTKFDRLIRHVDVCRKEKQRLKNIILNIIKREQEANPTLQKIEIDVISHVDEMEYQAANGNEVFKLKLTERNKTHWNLLRQETAELINKRISSDKYAIKRLSEPKSVET